MGDTAASNDPFEFAPDERLDKVAIFFLFRNISFQFQLINSQFRYE